MQKSRRKRVMQFFGCEDSVINTAALVHDHMHDDYKFSSNGIIGLQKRFFTVQCVTSCETLVFPFSDIDNMKRDFKMTFIAFIKIMMQ